MSNCSRSSSIIVSLVLASLVLPAAFGGMFTAFGPQTIPGSEGRSSSIVRHFTVLDPSTSFVLRVSRTDGTAARIRINGLVVVEPSDFSDKNETIEKPIFLDVDNEVTIDLLADLHGTVMVEVRGLDNRKPLIDYVIEPEPNAAGWNNRDTTVRFLCDDDTSEIASCSLPVVFRTDGENQTITGTAVDQAGNTSVVTATVNLDKTAPVLTLADPNTPDANGNVTIAGTVQDATSGIQGVACNGTRGRVTGGSFDCRLMVAGGTTPVEAVAVDRAGNVATAGPVDVIHVLTTTSAVITSPAHFGLLGPEVTPGEPAAVDVTVAIPSGANATGASVVVDGVAAERVSEREFVARGVPVEEGRNILTATVTMGGQQRTTSVVVTRDTTPPAVHIDTPHDGATLGDSSLSVSGRFHDPVAPLIGRRAPRITVNGIEATVSHGTFVAHDVPLKRGPNPITVDVVDEAGNAGTSTVVVTRRNLRTQRIRVVSGHQQTGDVDNLLDDPLVVELIGEANRPIAGRIVTFQVSRGDGSLQQDGERARKIHVPTDERGLAQLEFQLGSRSGAGNHRVSAKATGFAGEALFVASADPGPAAAVKLISGASQTGTIGERLPEPFVVLVHDEAGNPVSEAQVSFLIRLGEGDVDGPASPRTDYRGHSATSFILGDDEGMNAHLVTAALVEESPTVFETRGATTGPLPVAFFASGADVSDGTTSVGGVVLEQTGVPVAGATVSVRHPSRTSPLVGETDDVGEFSIGGVPVGRVEVEVEGPTTDPELWSPLLYKITTIQGRRNTVGRPIHLIEVDEDSATAVGGNADVALAMSDVPGMELVIPEDGAVCPDAVDPETCLATLTQVHADTLPVTPPGGVSPRLAWTIQPDDLAFAPTAQVQTPNVDDLTPGQVIDLFAFDPQRGEFIQIGTATVGEDGALIRSDPGAGSSGGWGFAAPPPPAPSCVLQCDDGNQCTDDFAVEPCLCENVEKQPDVPGEDVACDDGLYCTEEDRCAGLGCGGSPVEDRQDTVSQFAAIKFDLGEAKDAADALKYGPCEVGAFESLTLQYTNTGIEKCCESESVAQQQQVFKRGAKHEGSATVKLLSVECPVPGLSIKIRRPKVTIGLVVGLELEGKAAISAENVECAGATCEVEGTLSLGLSIYGELKIETPLDSWISLSGKISAGGSLSLGATCPAECGNVMLADFNPLGDGCQSSKKACIGPIGWQVSATLGAFIEVGFSGNIPNTEKCTN